MGSMAASELGMNCDALASVPGTDLLVAALTQTVGRTWGGGLCVINGSVGAVEGMVGASSGLASVACFPNSDAFTGQRVVASGADDGSVDLWYLSTAAQPATSGAGGGAGGMLQHAQAKVQHDGAVLSLAAAPAAAGGAAQLASASADGTLRLWDCGQLLASTAQLGSPGGAQLNACAWVQAGQLASAGGDGRLCLWDARQLGGAPAAAAALGAPVLSLAALGAGGQTLLVAGDQLGRLSVYDPRSLAAPLRQLQPHADLVHALAAAPPGERAVVASGGDDGGVALLDCAEVGAAPRQLVPARREGEAPCYVRALAWGGADGRQLFRGGWDGSVTAVPL